MQPNLPPLLSGHRVKGDVDPLTLAVAAARKGEAGAGDLYFSDGPLSLHAALVLEPERRLAEVLDMQLVAMVALGDALGANIPPEIAVEYLWPDTVLVNGARAGSAATAWSASSAARDPDATPAWLACSVGVRLRSPSDDPDPGHDPGRTSLWDEGAGALNSLSLVESLARHWLAAIHTWESEGPRESRQAWWGRFAGKDRPVRFGEDEGLPLGLDEVGNLLLRTEAGVETLTLETALRPGAVAG